MRTRALVLLLLMAIRERYKYDNFRTMWSVGQCRSCEQAGKQWFVFDASTLIPTQLSGSGSSLT